MRFGHRSEVRIASAVLCSVLQRFVRFRKSSFGTVVHLQIFRSFQAYPSGIDFCLQSITRSPWYRANSLGRFTERFALSYCYVLRYSGRMRGFATSPFRSTWMMLYLCNSYAYFPNFRIFQVCVRSWGLFRLFCFVFWPFSVFVSSDRISGISLLKKVP